MDKRGPFTAEEARIIIAEIVIAIEQIHKLGIIYRDIKLENILLDSDGHIVVVDFGLCNVPTKKSKGRSFDCCGTVDYMAPEMVRCFSDRTSGYDVNVDWWSLGILFYELLTGSSPFTVENESNREKHIVRRISNESPPMQYIIHDNAKDLITKLLIKEPTKRLGIYYLLVNEFF